MKNWNIVLPKMKKWLRLLRSQFKKTRSPQLITPKRRYDTGKFMADQEKFKTELYYSLSLIPEELLPELGERIYCNA